jgi:hypothetical protein
MNKTFTTLLSLSISLFSLAQTQITNGGFENWGGNPSPGVAAEPTSWYSNKSGSSTAQLGPQTCSQDGTAHTGSSCAKIETKTVPIIGTVVNGNLTTGVVNAPTTTKSDGYIGTEKYNASSDVRKMTFTGRPDSLVGWYKYTSGGTGETGKVTAILHTGSYYDPETPTGYHVDPTANKIARATFFTPTGNTASWKRFSVPFNYVSSATPAYIMVNITSSSLQTTNIAGSILWLDDLEAIYNTVTSVREVDTDKNIKVYYFEKNLYVDFGPKTSDQSTIDLYDVTGQVVLSQKMEGSSLNTIDVSSLKSGIYMYKVSGKSQGKFGKIFID